MTADNALNTYLGIYDIDATNMSHAEKIGKIYGIAFNNGIEHALCRVTEQDYIVMNNLRTGEDVEYVRFKRVLEIIDKEIALQKKEMENDLDAPDYLCADWRGATIDGMKTIRNAIQALQEEQG